MTDEIYALGIGHYTPVLIELAEACGYRVAGLYHYNDERTGETDHGFPILGSFADMFAAGVEGKRFLLTMGDTQIRRALVDRLMDAGAYVPTLIHPTAVISRFAAISPTAVYIHPQVYVEADVKIAQGCMLTVGTKIGHQCKIGAYSTICIATIGAYTELEENVFVGIGAIVLPKVTKIIRKNAYIGAGSVVKKPVSENALMFGVPAKQIKTLR